ncbi:MAG: type II toxin-antitoxin system HipA family toxin [Alphaproteobacteria bacterium]|nr:type II toxin-antitoxin system HipA family toxin [Alphaproteobacteria bacterium]
MGLRFSDATTIEVGTLAETGRRVWFQYGAAFADLGLEISPLRLPLRQRDLHEHQPRPGVPIPGVFNDARPDGWGLKLLHRAFQSRGRAASSVSPLDELAWLGPHTMGALVFEPCTGPESALNDAVELAALAAHAQTVWDDAVEEVLPELVRAGGPSGGARPKALVALPSDGGPGFRYGEGALPEGWEAWLVKFPTRRDDADVGRREGAWMQLAASAGLNVPEHRIFNLEGVGDAFAVRRFDRLPGGRRTHVLSGAGALDMDFRTATADYQHLLRATAYLCAGDQSQVLEVFRLAAFNVATVNQDDHLKNIAWLMDEAGAWRLAPGFDLTYAPQPYGERATTVAGVGRGVQREHLLELASRAGIKGLTARRVLDEVTAATARVESVLKQAGCCGAVSEAAVRAVLDATERVRG